MPDSKIFLSVSDGPNCAYIIKEFQKLGYEVHSGDMSDNTIGERLADSFVKLPPQDQENYPEIILEYVEKNGIDYFVPLVGSEALRMTGYRDDFEQKNCVLVAANEKTLRTSVDTVKLLDYLSDHTDLPIMEYEPFESLDEFTQARQRINSSELCVKPAEGSGTRGFCILDEKPRNATQVFGQKQKFLHLQFDQLKTILSESTSTPKLMLMEYLNGNHYDCNLVAREGSVLFQSIKTREDSVDGTITEGEIIEHDRIESLNRAVAEALNVTGMICTQYIGEYLIEINPRWSTSLNNGSINEYQMGLEVCAGNEPTVSETEREEYYGTRMKRYWDLEIFKEQ